MEKPRDINLLGLAIIEHRGDGETVVGRIEFASVTGDGCLDVDWHHTGDWVMGRETLFIPKCWRCNVAANGIFLERTSKEPHGLKSPWHDAELYEILW